ncbi:MAG TPA: CRISPR-associated helicase Cas3' [Clostridia bacterium]|nr:CRISPR-associated helicase Cas3' [Clostridia bacterium]
MQLIAHKAEDGRTQSFADHANNVAALAAGFAAEFGGQEQARILGLLHDIGKCSPAGQNRMCGDTAERVEHAAAGAEVLAYDWKNNPYGYFLSYCIAGHHTGLPDGGVDTDTEDRPTLCAKLKRQKLRNRDYAPFEEAIEPVSVQIPTFPLECKKSNRGFSHAFRTRMLFSCLVDADFLDTEAFMNNQPLRASMGEPIPVLYERLLQKLASFGTPDNLVAEKRKQVQLDCLRMAEQGRGIYTLTVPTGGGKTLSSLAFALKHAMQNNLRRVIYVIPYTSIIDQTAAVFRKALGEENVLEHHHNVNYESTDDRETDPRALATENWDAPIIVTTNVQFFESLFANRTSRCRKLHNIANSVIIFDEAQMLPQELLIPCVQAIDELVRNHRCTAVLCSATQPALQQFFGNPAGIREICTDHEALYQALRRVRFETAGQLDDNTLLQKLNQHNQVLCIVNTKLQAQTLFAGLSGEGNYHLSTLMTPAHRKRILAEIRALLDPKRTDHPPCRVISTSLIEAGVDVDFPVVYREEAGLDSAIQAAGRCNREGLRSAEDSVVFLFQPEERYQKKRPSSLTLPIEIARIVMKQYADMAAPDAICAYFTRLFSFRGDALDQKGIVRQINDGVLSGLSIPFAKIAEEFRVIESPTRTILIPNDSEKGDRRINEEVRGLIAALRAGARSKNLLRKAGLHAVSVYTKQFELLLGAGALEILDGELAVLRDETLYSNKTGLCIPKDGIAIVC